MLQVLYHNDFSLNLSSYGISIPLEDDRAEVVFKALRDRNSVHEIDIDQLPQVSQKELSLVHTKEYLERIFLDRLRMQCVIEGFELLSNNAELVRFSPTSLSRPITGLIDQAIFECRGTCFAAKKAIEENCGVYILAGGMHHAMSDHPSGFCLLNDIALSIRLLQKESLIKTAWIIDVDAHKGDGDAEIFYKDKSVDTFSIHMKSGWPLGEYAQEGSKSLIPSSLDVEVEVGDDYLEKFKNGLIEFEKSFKRPDFIIILHGSDPYEFDGIKSSERLKLTLEEMLERDMILAQFLDKISVPHTYVIAGGYGKDSYKPYLQFLDKMTAEI